MASWRVSSSLKSVFMSPHSSKNLNVTWTVIRSSNKPKRNLSYFQTFLTGMNRLKHSSTRCGPVEPRVCGTPSTQRLHIQLPTINSSSLNTLFRDDTTRLLRSKLHSSLLRYCRLVSIFVFWRFMGKRRYVFRCLKGAFFSLALQCRSIPI